MTRNVKLAELNTKIVTAFLNIQTLLDHLRDYSGLCYVNLVIFLVSYALERSLI